MTTSAVTPDQYARWVCQRAASVLSDIVGDGPLAPAVVVTEPFRQHASEPPTEMVTFGSTNPKALEYARSTIVHDWTHRRIDFRLIGIMDDCGIILSVGHQPGTTMIKQHEEVVLIEALKAAIAAIITLVPADGLRNCPQCSELIVPDLTQVTCLGNSAHHLKLAG